MADKRRTKQKKSSVIWYRLILILGMVILLSPFIYDTYLSHIQHQYKDDTSMQRKKPNSEVNVASLGIGKIAQLKIPKLNLDLPVFQGTSKEVLDTSVGTLEHTDLPYGGNGKHSVLSAHRGLSLSKLFTDLPEMRKGDSFYITLSNNGKKVTHKYKVDRIRTVNPNSVGDYVEKDPNKDYITLLTCTPLFVNTDRILVRGHRVVMDKIEAPTAHFSLMTIALIVFNIIVLLMFIASFTPTKKSKVTH